MNVSSGIAANYEQGVLFTPGQSAAMLLSRLPSDDTGQIWDASDLLPAGEP